MFNIIYLLIKYIIYTIKYHVFIIYNKIYNKIIIIILFINYRCYILYMLYTICNDNILFIINIQIIYNI